MIKKILYTLATAMVLSTTVAFGAVREGAFSVTPLIGSYVYDKNDQGLDSSLMIGVRAGYNITKAIGVEALYDYVAPSDSGLWTLKDISMQRFGGQALYHFFPDSVFAPYLAAGYSRVAFSGSDVNDKGHGAFDYGVGVKYFVTDDIAIRGDLRHILYGYNSKTFNNVECAVGAYFQFGGGKPVVKAATPPPTQIPQPQPAQVVVPPALPSEPVKTVVVPISIPVSVLVLPVDSDGDGVNDLLDKCPGTPAGVAVDATGCPLDTDKDGVPDYLDKCPETPVGIAVDTNGCPLDTDKDGVADYLDRCPDTPTGVKVDGSGCPVDADKDGVPDYLDKCPETPAGTAVDASGCPVEVAKISCNTPAIIAVSFNPGKADIKAKYHRELDRLGKFLKEFPHSKGVIRGYTDADGGKEINLKLSQERTESVRIYIIKKFGIDGSRISAKGYGSAKPIASNKTDSGKAKNRRIEAIFSCE